jgi:uncharacterized RDD family membrane protein YckC
MYCTKCGHNNHDQANFCRQCGTNLQIAAGIMNQPAQNHPAPMGFDRVHYAGFWVRFAASLIDGVILFIPALILNFFFVILAAAAEDEGILTIPYLISLVGTWLYSALMESSSLQATLGKMMVGIKVTNRHGGRISFGQATGRYFAKILSQLILYIGFMMAGWTEKKQALHDFMAGTLVVRK